MSLRSRVASRAAGIRINPFVLVAGAIGIPLIANTLGRGILTPDQTAPNADAEFRRLTRNFAIYNALVAAGLGYATSRVGDERLQSAALGGAIGTAIIAGTLGTALVTQPSQEELERARREQAANNAKALVAAGTSPSAAAPAWMANLVGFPR